MPESPEQREIRLRRWRHFGAIGQVRFARTVIASMVDMPTATNRARITAADVVVKLDRLLDALTERAE